MGFFRGNCQDKSPQEKINDRVGVVGGSEINADNAKAWKQYNRKQGDNAHRQAFVGPHGDQKSDEPDESGLHIIENK